MTDSIVIKGIKDGLLVTVGDAGEWRDVQPVLLQKLADGGDFFRGAKLVLQVGNRPLRAVDLGKLRDHLSDLSMTLGTVLSESSLTRSTSQALGLAVELPMPPLPEIDPEMPRQTAVVVKQTLRSGRSVNYPGSVTIIGDVNPGAEVVAGGDVLIWGRAYGIIHAGAEGDESAVVCALELSPTQLRIAGMITTSPKRRGKPKPEMARIQNGQIMAETWDPRQKKR